MIPQHHLVPPVTPGTGHSIKPGRALVASKQLHRTKLKKKRKERYLESYVTIRMEASPTPVDLGHHSGCILPESKERPLQRKERSYLSSASSLVYFLTSVVGE